jgi:hypothetical protein
VNRMHFFALTLATGFCFALLAPGLSRQSELGWDSRESKSDIFDKRTSPATMRPAFLNIFPTLSEWERPRVSHAAWTRRTAQTQPNGARLSLTSLTLISSTLQTCQGGPDIVADVTSVLGDATINSKSCSSNAVNTPAGGSCSVNTTSNTMDRYQCSTDLPNGQEAAYCSTGPNGTNMGNGPGTCSTQGGSTNQNGNGSVVCSTAFTGCSTNGDGPANNAMACSTLAGQHQACSTGNGVGTSFCTATQGAVKSNYYCSVQVGTDNPGDFGNKCSSIVTVTQQNDQKANQTCSVTPPKGGGAAQSTDFCSVTENNAPDAQCTTLLGTGVTTKGTRTCSALGGLDNTKGFCSAKINGVFTPPNAQLKCGSATFTHGPEF